MEKIISKVKKEIEPNLKIMKKIDLFAEKINKTIKNLNIKAECIKGGSIAKKTFLKDDHDIDLFVRFDFDEYKDKELSDILESIIEKAKIKAVRVHGSRDYFQYQDNKLFYEIVPVLKVNDYKKALNVTDMSPLHVEWVNKNLNKKLRDDIRVTKQFCKSTGVYGAESYINGFSGHMVDILIVYYGSFVKLLKNSLKWKAKVIIDIEKHLKNPLKELNEAKLQSPMVIVDPVQPDRNAASALSMEKFDLFKEKARQFLEKPSEDFFKIRKIDRDYIINIFKETKKSIPAKNIKLIAIKIIPLEGKRDVVGSKILKVFDYINMNMDKNEFDIIKSGWDTNSFQWIYFITEDKKLSEYVIIKGPPVNEKEHCDDFRKTHSSEETFIKNKRMFLKTKRKYMNPEELIENLINTPYFKNKIKKTEFILNDKI
jgi:tRNA nucleotidyltransferase (CCA-adding enzyme)